MEKKNTSIQIDSPFSQVSEESCLLNQTGIKTPDKKRGLRNIKHDPKETVVNETNQNEEKGKTFVQRQTRKSDHQIKTVSFPENNREMDTKAASFQSASLVRARKTQITSNRSAIGEEASMVLLIFFK